MTASSPAVSYRSAVGDLRAGMREWELWGHLGWQTSASGTAAPCSARSGSPSAWRSPRSRWAPYAGLFGNDLAVQLPYILVGFIVWSFISGCISEGAEVFIATRA